MYLKRIVLLLLVTHIFSVLASQSEIDYKHRSLVKILQKSGVPDIEALTELSLSDSLVATRIKGKYFQLDEDAASLFKYIYVGRVNSCRAGGCSISSRVGEDDSSEYFDYFILFDKDKSVKLVKVFNYAASHGQEVTAKGWLRQFVGYNGDKPLQVDKNIDAISGATISVYAITEDVAVKTELLNQVL